MIYSVHDIMRDVRVCLDQNMTSEQLIKTGDVDSLALDDIIRSKIPEAVERVHCSAPTHLLELGHNFGEAVFWGDQESGWVLLPDDFMRLIVFEMSDWERGVSTVILPTDAEYAMQRQRIKALRGTSQRPVCAVVMRPEGRALEFYSCKSEEAYVRRAQYVPYPKIDADDGIDISERCYTAVVYAAASLVALTLGETEKSSIFSEISKTALQ
ncbi:MAG: hypothetical protein K2L55_01720 [Muribaculaceae bacterium]|nr:hypothetical protein [Muribaculaceae bacterium]